MATPGHPSEIVHSSRYKRIPTGRIQGTLSRSRTRSGVSARIAISFLHEDCRAMPVKSSQETPHLVGQESAAFDDQSGEVGWAWDPTSGAIGHGGLERRPGDGKPRVRRKERETL
jgi:hypothetical protein